MYDPANSDSITYNGHDCSDKDLMRFYDNGGFRVDFSLPEDCNVEQNDIIRISFYTEEKNFCEDVPKNFIKDTDVNKFEVNRIYEDSDSFYHDVTEENSKLLLQNITNYENNEQTFILKVTENIDKKLIKLRINVDIENILWGGYFGGNYDSLPTNRNPKTTLFYKIDMIRNEKLFAQTRNNEVDKNPWKYFRFFKGLKVSISNVPSEDSVNDDELTPKPYPDDELSTLSYPNFGETFTLSELDCIYEKMKNKTICSNDKVIKETIDKCVCPGTVITTRFTDKNGIALANSSNSYKSYFYKRAMLFNQNAQGLLPETLIPNDDNLDKLKNTHYIGTQKPTVYNKNSGKKTTDDCEIFNIKRLGINDITYQYKKIPVAIKKFRNNSNTSKSRLSKLKYQTNMRSSNINNQYNNCISGNLCQKYITPGDNSKNKTQKILCISKITKEKPSICINTEPCYFEDNNIYGEELSNKRNKLHDNYIEASKENAKTLNQFDEDNDANDPTSQINLPEIVCQRDVTVML